jgi:hypothetical protein
MWPHFNSVMLSELVSSVTEEEPVSDTPDVNYEVRIGLTECSISWLLGPAGIVASGAI